MANVSFFPDPAPQTCDLTPGLLLPKEGAHEWYTEGGGGSKWPGGPNYGLGITSGQDAPNLILRKML